MAGYNTTLIITVTSAEGATASVILQVLVSVPAFQLSVQPPSVHVRALATLCRASVSTWGLLHGELIASMTSVRRLRHCKLHNVA